MNGNSPLMPVADALARILAAPAIADIETAPLREAFGRTSVPTSSRGARNHPRTCRRWTATPSAPPTLLMACERRWLAKAPRGAATAARLRPGEAVRIFTGAPVPSGADTILIQEDADVADKTIAARGTLRAGCISAPPASIFAPAPSG